MKKKDIIIILTSVFIFVLIWIGFNIYHNSVKSTISDSVSLQISPISATFDISAVDKLKKRRNVTPVFQTSGTGLASSDTETPVIITPHIESSGSATEASSGGTISP